MATYHEARDLPVLPAGDVLVCGGGSAGIMAAWAAARVGCQVTLLDPAACPGGTSAIGLPLLGFHDGARRIVGGLPYEFLARLQARGGLRGDLDADRALEPDPELLKLLAIEVLDEAGVRLLLHTFVADAVVRDGRLWGVIVEGKGGRRVLTAARTIDCTGDGDLCASAGVPMAKADGQLQPPTLMFTVGNVDLAAWQAAGGYGAMERKYAAVSTAENFRNPRRHDFSGCWRLGDRPNEVAFNCTRVLSIDATDPDDLTRAEVEGRYQAWEFLDRFLRPHVPGFEAAYIATTFAKVGIRETRRIVGEYVITEADLWSFRKFDDAIACGCYPIDVHSATDETTHFPHDHFYGGRHYTIPYRALLPLGVEDLLVAGRCLSCDHLAFGGLRVIGNTMPMGQAAGTAAALSHAAGLPPRRLDPGVLRSRLLADGCYLGEEV